MAQTVFFSWQSDTPNRVGRSFLKEVLEEVCKGIASDPTVDEALRDLELDSDIQGVPGQPPIVDTILKKIDASAVFVGDMTLVGARENGSRVPNPNVLIEYGWALKALGHERVIWVMNTAYGKPIGENLPFDLRHAKRPTCYHLPEGAIPELKKSEKQKLVKALSKSIRASLETVPTPVVDPPKFPEALANDGPARFRKQGNLLGYVDNDPTLSSKKVILSQGPAMWLRLMPATDSTKRWTVRELWNHAISTRPFLMPLVRGPSSLSTLRADDGVGIFSVTDRSSKSDSIETRSVGFIFQTGEIWSIDVSLLRDSQNRLPLVERYFVDAIRDYGLLLQSLGVQSPYRWIAGIVGVNGRYFSIARYEPLEGGKRCVSDLIQEEGQYSCEDDPAKALGSFFQLILEKCGL